MIHSDPASEWQGDSFRALQAGGAYRSQNSIFCGVQGNSLCTVWAGNRHRGHAPVLLQGNWEMFKSNALALIQDGWDFRTNQMAKQYINHLLTNYLLIIIWCLDFLFYKYLLTHFTTQTKPHSMYQDRPS